jgi:sporulation protein YlmC with PRC-barrel domain
MNNTHKKAVMRAAVIAGVALGASATGAVANAQTGPVQPSAEASAPSSAGNPGGVIPRSTGVSSAGNAFIFPDQNTAPVAVSRISVSSGSQAGGTTMTIVGTNLASQTIRSLTSQTMGAQSIVPAGTTVTFTIPAATRGGRATEFVVGAEDVTVVSSNIIRVTTPGVPVAGRATVTVTNGLVSSPSAGAPAFTFTPAAPSISAEDGVVGEVTSEAGGTVTINGAYLGDTKSTVLIGGKAATVTLNNGSSMAVTVPKGLAPDYQEVVVTTTGGTVDAGLVEVTATTPAVEWGVLRASVEKGATLEVTGEDLQLITGGTLTDAKGAKIRVAVKQPSAVADRGAKLTVVVPARVTAGTGSLVLTTPYASTESQQLIVEKAGKPAITSKDVTVGGAGGTITLDGTNLHFVQSVKVGAKTVAAGSGYSTNDASTQLTIAVPSQSRVPATVSVTVITDGGSAIYQLRVTASSLTSAAYNSDLKVITLNGASLGKLTGIKVTAADESVIPATFTASLDGGTSTSATLAQALTPGTYTVSGVDASRVTLSTTFTVSPAPTGTLASAAYNAQSKVITLTGTAVGTLQEVVVTGANGALVGVAFTPAEGGLTAVSGAFAQPLAAGTYTVTAKNSAGTALTAVPFTVAAPATGTLASAAYDVQSKVVTLTGTAVGTLQEVVVTGPNGALSGVTFTPAGDGLTAVSAAFAQPLAAGAYTVTAKNSAGAALASVPFTVAATGTLTSAAYDAISQVITLTGTAVDTLQGIVVTDNADDSVVNVAFTPTDGTTTVSGTFTTPGDYTVNANNSAGTALTPVTFTVPTVG